MHINAVELAAEVRGQPSLFALADHGLEAGGVVVSFLNRDCQC